METLGIKRLTGKVGHLVDYPGQADNGPAKSRRVAILAGHVQNSYQLVVKSGRFQRGRLVDAIYRNLRGAGAPVDVIVVTPEEVERYRDDPCLIIAPALKEGKVVYAA
jgi:hypothetical protein